VTVCDVEVIVDVPVPDVGLATCVVPAPGEGEGNWSGAPSAAADPDGGFWLAYRVRRPLGRGRGVAVVLAHYDGRHLEPVAEIHRDTLGAESLERPALVRRADGGWRVYVSCATPDTKHWWVEAFDADDVAGLSQGRRHVVFPGDALTAIKDPVVLRDETGWHAWVCCHPLDLAGEEDRMWSAYSRSDDGLAWSEPVPVLLPRPGFWDSRGARITAVLPGRPGMPGADGPADDRLVAFYDGRARASQNWFERTGVAASSSGADLGAALTAVGTAPAAESPYGTGALRYVCVVSLPGGGHQMFFEASRRDGAHDLMTQSVPPAPGRPRGRACPELLG